MMSDGKDNDHERTNERMNERTTDGPAMYEYLLNEKYVTTAASTYWSSWTNYY